MTAITVTTTENLPAELGGDKPVKVMSVIQVWDNNDPAVALTALTDLAQNNGWHAVIGVRFLVYPVVSSDVSPLGPLPTHTHLRWSAYGTALAW